MKTLTIRPVPFETSKLAAPPSPFSPRSPLYPIEARPVRRSLPSPPSSLSPPLSASSSAGHTRQRRDPLIPLPEHQPLTWLWRCHECHRTYPLGATRRCLSDGHHFCAGAVPQRTVRAGSRTRRRARRPAAKPCASEFDYAGWKTWAVWRRAEAEARALQRLRRAGSDVTAGAPPPAPKAMGALERRACRDCWECCDYPSECRWGAAYGVPSPPPPVRPPTPTEIGSREEDEKATLPTETSETSGERVPTSFEEILGAVNTLSQVRSLVSRTGRSRDNDRRDTDAAGGGEETMEAGTGIWPKLAGTGRRRAERTGMLPSPLRLHPVTEEVEDE